MRSYRWIRCFKPLLTLTASWAFYLFLASLYQEKTAKVKVNECNNEASTINTTTTTTEVPIQRDHQAIFKALIDTNSTFLGQFCECDGKEELLVFIHSKSHDVNLRNLIRNTWGSRRLRGLTKARIFFVVGHSNSSNSLRQDLIWENDIHNDIIEGPFDETGLTEFEDIKFMIWLKWYRIQCPNAPFAFNIDANRNAVDLIQLAELASSLNSNNYELIFGIDDEYSYLMTNVTGQRLYSLLLEKRSFNLEPSYLNRHLAPEARLSALKDIGLPIIRAESMDAQERYWEEMKKKHGLADDITRPVFLTNFTTTSYENYVINEPDYCQTTWRGIEDLIVVHSNPSQEDFRTHIRITWGDERIFETLKMRPLFFLGRSADPLVEERVKSEAAKFGDIIQTDYLDTYKNLTYKAVSWMLWVKLYCSGISSLVKTDDDIVVDVFKLKNYSERVSNSDRIFCHYWKYGRIFRDPRNKHYVSEETFAKKKFPPYCSGSAYILNAKISRALLEEFQRDSSFLWIDDVFVTGILAQRARVKHHSIASSYVLSEETLLSDEKAKRKLIFAHLSGRSSHDFRLSLWDAILRLHKLKMTEKGIERKSDREIQKDLEERKKLEQEEAEMEEEMRAIQEGDFLEEDFDDDDEKLL